MRSGLVAIGGALYLLGAGCGSAETPAPETPRSARPGDGEPGSSRALAGLSGHVVAGDVQLDPLPQLARRAGGGLILFHDTTGWATVAIDEAGAPKGAAARLELDADRAVLEPTETGYLVLAERPVERNHALSLLPLTPAGLPAAPAQMVTQVPDEVTWLELFASPKGSLVLWEIDREGQLDVMVAPASADGTKILGAPSVIARGVVTWRAIEGEAGIAVAAITPDGPAPAAQGAANARGNVQLFEVSPKGVVRGPTAVGPRGSASVDVELGRAGANYLLAWTDDSSLDPSVRLASVAPGGRVVASADQAIPPKGDQAVVSLASAAKPLDARATGRAVLAWEEIGPPGGGPRAIHLAPVDEAGKVGSERAVLWMAATGAPDLVADAEGFTAITLAPAMLPADLEPVLGEDGEPPIWPTFARFARDLTVVGGEPIRVNAFGDASSVPAATFGLSCHEDRCLTLAVSHDGDLATVQLPRRESPWLVAARRAADEAPPRAMRLVTLFEGEPLTRADAASVADGSGTVLGAVTVLAPAQSGDAAEAGQALLERGSVLVMPVSRAAEPPVPTAISRRASAVGGVAIASRPGKERADSVVTWVELVDGDPQVFAARVRPDGTKIRDKAVTKATRPGGKAEPLLGASDVAIAETDDGFVLAWVDTRDRNGEVYAAKLDRDLGKMIKDTRITDAAGDAADVRLAVQGDEIVVVWSDSRTSSDVADIYLARLDARSLVKKAPEVRLFASSSHSRSPTLAPTPSGHLVAWVEEGTVETQRSGEPGGGARIAEIDREGRVVGAPRSLGEGTVTGVALTCGSREEPMSACRLLLTETDGATSWITAVSYEIGVGSKPGKTLLTLGSGLVSAPAVVFDDPRGRRVLFTEDLPGGRGRLRLLSIDWGDAPHPASGGP